MTRTPTQPQTAYVPFERFIDDPHLDEHTEWVDGTVVPMHSIQEPHDRLFQFLYPLLVFHVRLTGIGRILSEPYTMKLEPNLSARCPDIFFVNDANRDRIGQKYLAGPADLVIEITSPSSRVRDRVHKFAEYESAGVPEYWVLDPDEKAADFFRLGDDGRFAAVELEDGVYTTDQLPAMRLNVDWLWQADPPDPIAILRDWGMI